MDRIDSIINSIYKDDLLEYSKKGVDKLVFNSSAAHTEITRQAMMKYAKEYVYILASYLHFLEMMGDSDYVYLIKKFLRKSDRKLMILLTHVPEGVSVLEVKSPAIDTLRRHYTQVIIKSLDGRMTMKSMEINFEISDDRAYRLETDIEKRMAYANFNSPSNVATLKDKFIKAFDSTLATELYV